MARKEQEAKMALLGYVTPRQAGEWIGITPASVTRLAGEGKIECTRAARFLYVSVSGVRKYLGPAAAALMPTNDKDLVLDADGKVIDPPTKAAS